MQCASYGQFDCMKHDRERWGRRYENEPASVSAPDELLATHAHLLTGGRGLDVACGRSGNALFLAQHGYRMDVVDISFKAVSDLMTEAAHSGLPVRAFVADLDDYPLPRAAYDLVTVFYFFDVKLMPPIAACLKPRGLLFYATFNQNHRSLKPEFNPDYLVSSQGLAPYFTDLEILLHDVTAGADGNICRLIAQKSPR